MSDANSIQQIFSHDHLATLWRAIPAFEELQTAWENKLNSATFELYHEGIRNGLEKIRKYYSKFDEKPVFVLALSKFSVRIPTAPLISLSPSPVL